MILKQKIVNHFRVKILFRATFKKPFCSLVVLLDKTLSCFSEGQKKGEGVRTSNDTSSKIAKKGEEGVGT